MQNSVPMPITSVRAECSGAGCWENIRYSIKTGNKNFYIDNDSGDVHLISINGRNSIKSTCDNTWCSLVITATLTPVSEKVDEMTLNIRSVSENSIIVLDTDTSMDEIDKILDQINQNTNVTGKYWFRKLNVQPKIDTRTVSGVDGDSVIFVTALDVQQNNFINSDAVGAIIG